MEFEVKFEDGSTKEIELPEKLGYVPGRAYVRALNAKVKVKEGKKHLDIDNVGEFMNGLQDVTREKILKPRLSEEEFNQLSHETVIEATDIYEEQIWSSIKKKAKRDGTLNG